MSQLELDQLKVLKGAAALIDITVLIYLAFYLTTALISLFEDSQISVFEKIFRSLGVCFLISLAGFFIHKITTCLWKSYGKRMLECREVGR